MIRIPVLVVAGLLVLAVAMPCLGAETAVDQAIAKMTAEHRAIFELQQKRFDAEKAKAALEVADSTIKEQNYQSFKGFGPGVGISLAFYFGSNTPVKEAEVVNGIVRATAESSIVATIMFESHYFFTKSKDSRFGHGPYAGVLSSTEDIIDAVGLGWMVGARREDSSKSFNFGAGVVFNPEIQVLGDGITEGEPLPAGETSIRYKKTSAWGAHVLLTFHF